MNILNKLSIKNLKMNKKRTISTIIGIILSCALICAVATMVMSFQATLVQNAINETGYYHLKISNISSEKLDVLKNNRDIQNIRLEYNLGYSYFEHEGAEDQPYINVYSLEKNNFENLAYKIIEGEFPKNSEEILISEKVANDSNYEIGDTIELNIGKRVTLDNYELNEKNPETMQETLADTVSRSYKIVGIVDKYNTEHMYYGITTNDDIGEVTAYVTLKNPYNYKEDIAEILGASSYSEVEYYEVEDIDYVLNNELLRWEVFAFNDSTVAMLYSVAGVVIFIIIFTSVFCIRNSFAIATTEKMKMYGMLASVGATKKQIRKNVISEALMLGTIAIPIGILSGIVAVFVLIKIVNMLLGDYLLANVDGIIVKIGILPIILTIVLSIITIYLSAISSARKASKVSPIDLLRNSNEINIKGKTLKTPKIISKIFKTGGELAYKNLKRSKKKYRTTVISIAISIFIFITMNSFITNMFGFTGNYYEDYDYNVSVICYDNENVEKIQKLDNIDECYVVYENYDYIELSNVNGAREDVENPRLMVIMLDDETFRKYADKINVNYDKVKSSGILCDWYIYSYDGKQTKKRIYNYEVNDTIIGEMHSKDSIEEVKINVGAITDIEPYGYEKTYYDGGYIILNQAEYLNIPIDRTQLLIQSSNTEELTSAIENIDPDIICSDFEKSAKGERAMALVIKIFLYGFITIITLIGVTNIFNTITSNMELRQKEFAMLKSIGMTKKEFNRMVNLETIFYSVKSLIYGIVLGLLGTFVMYKAFSVKFDSGMYIPINPIIISIVAVFILVFVIMKYSINKISKQNIIETIRKENI